MAKKMSTREINKLLSIATKVEGEEVLYSPMRGLKFAFVMGILVAISYVLVTTNIDIWTLYYNKVRPEILNNY